MATLNSSNIVNGNIIEPNDLLQLYNALTAGGGTTGAYDISISGSLTGSATSATTATTALTSSKSTIPAPINIGTYYLTFVEGTGTYAPKIDNNLEYNTATNNLVVTASYATLAATSTNATTAINLTSTAVMPSGSNPSSNFLAVAAGSLVMTGSVATTATTDALKNKVLGQTLFINATIFNAAGSGNVVWIRSYNPATGQFQLQTAGGTNSEFVLWTAMYVPS